MKYRIAINGFGRIGRLTFRSLIEKNLENLEIIAINDLAPVETNIHLLKYDSIHGEIKTNFNIKDNKLKLKNNDVIFLKESDPQKLNWKEMDIDLVIECTGIFTKEKLQVHLSSG